MKDRYDFSKGTKNPYVNKVELTLKELQFLLSLLPSWTKEVPKGLDPTSYGTGSYEGDLKVKARIDAIRAKLDEA